MDEQSGTKFTVALGSHSWTLTGFWAALAMFIFVFIVFQGVAYTMLIVYRALAGS